MKPSRPIQNNCPDIEELYAFTEGKLPETGRASIQEHLMGCELCLKEVYQIKKTLKAVEGQKMALPMGLKQKALSMALGDSLVKQSTRRISEFVVSLGEKGIHYLSNLLLPEGAQFQVLWPSPLPVGAFRNGEQKDQESVIIEETMGEIKIKVILLHTTGPGITIRISVSKNTEVIPDQRISLYQEESLLGSKLTSREGSIEFPDLGFGYYSIKVPQEEIEMRFRINPAGQ
jgi:hypothetical protein